MKLYLKPILLSSDDELGDGGGTQVGPTEGSGLGGDPEDAYTPQNLTRGVAPAAQAQEMMPLEIPEVAEVAPQAVDEPKRIAPAIEIEPIELG